MEKLSLKEVIILEMKNSSNKLISWQDEAEES